ncbi:MAG: hypothetical protein ABSF28_02130 [Terracidiphilus sp.]
MKRPSGVTFSAVLLVLGSLLQLLLAAMMALGAVLLQSQLGSGGPTGTTAATQMPAWMPIFEFAMVAIFVALAAWGIVTAVGLFRMRRWARYSVLVIGGGLALLGLCSMLSMLFMLFVPLPVATGVDASQGPSVQTVTRIIVGVVGLFYAILCAVGVSWLVYFNLKKVRAAFADATAELVTSRRPFLISVLAVLNLIGATGCLLMVFLPLPGVIFGWVFHGWEKAALYLVFAALEAAVGVGLWRMKKWGYQLTLGFMAFGLIQSVVYLVRPSLVLRYMDEVNGIISPIQSQSPLPAGFQTAMMSASFGFSVLFMLAILAVLIYYRSVFNEPVRPPQETAIQA